MRQRLSSEPDRYRGRRRVPTPPRGRYAAVGAAAFVGAGVVALGAASNVPDAKAVDPNVLAELQAAKFSDDIADRNGDRADRSSRNTESAAKLTPEQAQERAWRLPIASGNYRFTSEYGIRGGKLHAGIDLAADEGTPFKSVFGGTVTEAGYLGGFGYAVTVRGEDGLELTYAHARRILVRKGETVKPGQTIGMVGNTGSSYGSHLHIEADRNGKLTDPITVLTENGVDIDNGIESVYGDLAAS